MGQSIRIICGTLVFLSLAACLPENDDDPGEAPIRALKTVLISETEESILRRFPSVLQPSELTVLSFESPGRLGPLNLSVGQTVTAGDVIAQLDDTELKIQIASAEAALEQARVTAKNAAEALTRAESLFESGTITKVSLDNARTEAVAQAQLVKQSESALASAREQLEKSTLLAPFDATIASVDQQSFATIAAGTPIAAIYREGVFEVSFTVNFDTVSRLVVGTPATLVLADDPSRSLSGVITELGAWAETVSSFPVIVAAQDVPDFVKAGMAVEVQLEFPLPAAQGYTIPFSSAVIEGETPQTNGPGSPTPIAVYVFDPETETVKKRIVTMAGIRENQFLVIEGLAPGDRVASAGVSFLSDGMQVKLVE